MSPLIVWLLRTGLISGFASLILWIAVYTKTAKWWHNAIGRTLVAKTALIAALLVPSILALFFHFTRLTSEVAAWIDTALIWLITPVMVWRTAVWVALARGGRLGLARNGGDAPGMEHEKPPTGTA